MLWYYSIIIYFEEHQQSNSPRIPIACNNRLSQGLGRSDFAEWYLICGYVNGSATSCPNGI